MALCAKCQDRNPPSPTYSKAKPVSNANCASCGNSLGADFQSNSSDSKPLNLIAGNLIQLTDLSNSNIDEWIISVLQFIDLTVDLTVDLFDSGDTPIAEPVLWGIEVYRIDLSWAYNKIIATQALTNNHGLTPPVLDTTDLAYQYLNAMILNENRTFTITGNDGQGQGGSQAADSHTILFSNYRVWGIGVRYDSGTTLLSIMEAFVDALIASTGTKEQSLTRAKNPLTAEGGELEHFYYCYPARLGFAIFLQNNQPGGMKRLSNQSGTIVVGTLDAYDPGEGDITVSNGLDSEPYLVYQSTGDGINGAIFEVI